MLIGILGFIPEWRAEQGIEALQQVLAPSTTVWRSGRQQVIAAELVVPGDLVILETRDRVPADIGRS